jgi:hypothetical protein
MITAHTHKIQKSIKFKLNIFMFFLKTKSKLKIFCLILCNDEEIVRAKYNYKRCAKKTKYIQHILYTIQYSFIAQEGT